MKNMLRHFKTWFSYTLILIVLCHFGLVHGDVSAYVLCFGEDGHVAVERADHHHRIHADKVSLTEAKTGAYFTNADLPCTDIPIVDDDHGSHIPLSALSKTSIDLGFLPQVFLFFLPLPYARAIIRRPCFNDLLFTDSRLLGIRSTVLLI